ncbi:MAG: hypothetical protein GX811_07245, partial [Lentisphaerae bacterium]|nr:hypothetical protein [Lentisphaerota bacterium]
MQQHMRKIFSSILFSFFFLAVFSVANAATRVWDGGGANALASTPGNWDGNVAPESGDDILLDTTSSKDMTWDLDISVGNWTQDGYDGTVTILTVYDPAGFTNLHISGNCILNSGTWTHLANPNTVTGINNEMYRLSVSVAGNMTIGAGVQIDISGKGFVAGRGPDSVPSGNTGGGSHGGRGSTYGSNLAGPTYGSITRPTNLGSGGGGSAGGGALALYVMGELSLEGLIAANGVERVYHAGAGGSVLLDIGS